MVIIRTLQLRRKLRDLTPELLLVALSMGTTTVAATLTRTWSEQMYPWASQSASRTLACFTFHKQVTRQIRWFSQLLAFPIMIDHTMSVSSCDFYRLKNFPGKLIWVNFAEFWCFFVLDYPQNLVQSTTVHTRYIYNGKIDFTIDDLPSELGDLNTPHKGGGGSRRSRRSRSSNSRFRQ